MSEAALADQRLKADAENRSKRTFVQGLYIDIMVAIAAFIMTTIATLDLTSKQAWLAVGLSFVKTIFTTLASYIMRLYGDKSRLPSGPLPPEDPGPPTEEVVPNPPMTAARANDQPEGSGAPVEERPPWSTDLYQDYEEPQPRVALVSDDDGDGRFDRTISDPDEQARLLQAHIDAQQAAQGFGVTPPSGPPVEAPLVPIKKPAPRKRPPRKAPAQEAPVPVKAPAKRPARRPAAPAEVVEPVVAKKVVKKVAPRKAATVQPVPIVDAPKKVAPPKRPRKNI